MQLSRHDQFHSARHGLMELIGVSLLQTIMKPLPDMPFVICCNDKIFGAPEGAAYSAPGVPGVPNTHSQGKNPSNASISH